MGIIAGAKSAGMTGMMIRRLIMSNECSTCIYLVENKCVHENNKDNLKPAELRSFSRASQLWYKSCGKDGKWHVTRIKHEKPNKLDIVEFKNGTYGIRKVRDGRYIYFDFASAEIGSEHWWNTDSRYFLRDCKLKSLDTVKKHYNNILFDTASDKGKPI